MGLPGAAVSAATAAEARAPRIAWMSFVFMRLNQVPPRRDPDFPRRGTSNGIACGRVDAIIPADA